MNGYIVLVVFAVLVFSCLFFYIKGNKQGRNQAAAEYAEELRIKAQNEKDFRQAANEIKKETFKNANEKKAELSNGSSGRERFDNINDGLRNNSPG